MANKWVEFDKDDPKTHPPVHDLVWMFLGEGGVSTLGFFDGEEWDDDPELGKQLTHWMEIAYPPAPEGYGRQDDERELG